MGFIGGPYFAGLLYETYINVGDNRRIMSHLYELTDESNDPLEIEDSLSEIVQDELKTYEAQQKPENEHNLSLSSNQKKYLIVFSNDLECHTLGSANHAQGCSIALPYYLRFSRLEDVDDRFLYVRLPSSNLRAFGLDLLQDRFKLNLNCGKGLLAASVTDQLRQSLVLSEAAKRYAVRRSLHQVNSSYSVLRAAVVALPAIGSLGLYMLINAAVRHTSLLSSSVRLPCAAFLFVLTPLVYKLCDRYVETAYVTELDTEIVERDPTLKSGAVEFFQKQLKRNQALKELFCDRGEAM